MKYRSSLLLVVVIVACGGGGGSTGGDDASTGGPADAHVEPDAAAALAPYFRFAVVGDTRPVNEDDVAGYPTAVITKIWADVEAVVPHPDFAISTGDYMFASPYLTGTASTIDKQLDLYLAARSKFTNTVFAAAGNHECTGATASNCGQGNRDGITPNFAAYLQRMANPQGFTQPYYEAQFHASDMSWTMKIVVVAANMWSDAQATWLDTALAQPTTYTFVVRHESASANTAPGVTPSEAIINAHPVTLKIVGHTHTYSHLASTQEVICGNGGAPPTSGMNYGYAIVERLASGVIQFTEYDYLSNAVKAQWRINADGSTAP